MIGKNIVRFGLAALLAAGAIAVGSPRSLAQGPGGGFQMTPEMKAKIEAWRKWRDNHKKPVF